MQTDRAEYTRLRDEILINPYKEQQENKDLVTNNPLAETKDSVWSKYFELQVASRASLAVAVRCSAMTQGFAASRSCRRRS